MSNLSLIVFLGVVGAFILSSWYIFSRLLKVRLPGDKAAAAMTFYVIASTMVVVVTLLLLLP